MEEASRETYISVYAPIVQDERTVLVYNQRGPYKGTWGLPGGGVEFGETPEDAIRRELWEELGVQIETLALYDVHSHRTVYERTPTLRIDFHHIALLYQVMLKSPPAESILSPDSSEKASWHLLRDLASLPLSPCARHSLLSHSLVPSSCRGEEGRS